LSDNRVNQADLAAFTIIQINVVITFANDGEGVKFADGYHESPVVEAGVRSGGFTVHPELV
jgi:hypothetical protein